MAGGVFGAIVQVIRGCAGVWVVSRDWALGATEGGWVSACRQGFGCLRGKGVGRIGTV